MKQTYENNTKLEKTLPLVRNKGTFIRKNEIRMFCLLLITYSFSQTKKLIYC